MTSEDFGYLAAHIPATMFWLGVGGDEPQHSDRFAPDESVIVLAVELVTEFLTRR
ncbi:hypothetical protein ACWCQN_04060 [Streptomyces sp. NPDC001984]|uniref:hypothetical protein n=1 Tax=Streptomyces sp. NPDC002619 TaxID=3364655 RepID=UPI0036C17D56